MATSYVKQIINFPSYNRNSNNVRKMVFTIGPPGHGKTHYATECYKHDNSAKIVSADDFFYKTDENGIATYIFDRTKLSEAHSHCINNVKKALNDFNIKTIVVCNTNLSYRDMIPYIKMITVNPASKYATTYNISFVIMKERTCSDAYRDNIHGVPDNIIKIKCKMFRKLTSYNPKRKFANFMNSVVRYQPTKRVCKFFNSAKGCSFGDKCLFIHSTL